MKFGLRGNEPGGGEDEGGKGPHTWNKKIVFIVTKKSTIHVKAATQSMCVAEVVELLSDSSRESSAMAGDSKEQVDRQTDKQKDGCDRHACTMKQYHMHSLWH